MPLTHEAAGGEDEGMPHLLELPAVPTRPPPLCLGGQRLPGRCAREDAWTEEAVV